MDIITPAQRVKPKNLIQTIERVTAILDMLAQTSKGVNLGDIAAAVDLPKGTTHRLLSSLMYFDFIRQDDESRKYSLGFKLAELGGILLEQIDLRREAEPFLHALSNRVGETVYLVILDGVEVVYIEKIEPEDSSIVLRATSKVGQRNAVNSCSLGKVLLAHLSEQELESLLKKIPFVRKTANTITNPNQLKEHLQSVRAQGYAIDDEESEEGIRCVAAPVFNDRKTAVAAISISGAAIRMTRQKIEETLKDEVMQTALQISHKLGFRER